MIYYVQLSLPKTLCLQLSSCFLIFYRMSERSQFLDIVVMTLGQQRFLIYPCYYYPLKIKHVSATKGKRLSILCPITFLVEVISSRYQIPSLYPHPSNRKSALEGIFSQVAGLRFESRLATLAGRTTENLKVISLAVAITILRDFQYFIPTAIPQDLIFRMEIIMKHHAESRNG